MPKRKTDALERITDGYHEWRVSEAEFKGFMRAKLDAIHEDMKNMNEKINNTERRVGKAENEITGLNIKSGVWGLVGGMIATVAIILSKVIK